jgi:hypothetical protein
MAVSMVRCAGSASSDVLVLAVVAHVGELLLADGVHVRVVGAVVLADDHALVHLDARDEEEDAARLQVEERVGRRDALRSETMAPFGGA